MATPKNIVVLTGAGISAESGIPTFRAADGLWENHRVEDVATPEAFTRNPEQVHRFYNERRAFLLDGIEPNAAHVAIAEYSQQHEDSFTLVTQNIDDLHLRANTKNNWPMHGELLKMRCQQTQKIFDCHTSTSPHEHCPCCDKPGNWRPHIVWFGEMPLYMEAIESALSKCDLFVAIGTSGNVYPAAGFAATAKYYGAHCVEMNIELSAAGDSFDEYITGLASETVPLFFSALHHRL